MISDSKARTQGGAFSQSAGVTKRENTWMLMTLAFLAMPENDSPAPAAMPATRVP
jgi:hypothetical protein